MKWLSVKKYKPPFSPEDEDVSLTLTCKTKSGKEVVAWMDFEDGEWYVGTFIDFGSPIKDEVTHFAIPDPIEIEEE